MRTVCIKGIKKRILPILLVIGMGLPLVCFGAGPRVAIVVKTVLASNGSKFLDPRLSTLIKELQTVFRYTSYRLLSENPINLGIKETGTVALEGNRSLKITPLRIKGSRVELRLVILKKRKQIFQTVIQLLNNSSIIVGGPTYKDGYLLFNISSSF